MFKRIITAALVMAATVACATREEKAEKLIDGLMREALADYDSYEPVKTTIDSLFDVPTENPDLIALGASGFCMTIKSDSLVKAAERNMRTARVSMFSNYSKSVRCVQTAHKYVDEAKEMQKEIDLLKDNVIVLASKCTGEHSGWQFTHVYRYAKNGEPALGVIVVNTDIKVRTITSYRNKEDNNHIRGVSFIRFTLKSSEYSKYLNI